MDPPDLLSPKWAVPSEWYVCFYRWSPYRWIRRLALGRRKHVSAFGFVEAAQCWVFVEVTLGDTQISVVPDHLSQGLMARFMFGADVVKMKPLDRATVKPGYWCVPVVAHILGLPGCALRPDALFRQCLRHGGELVKEPKHDAEAKSAGRPAG